MLHTVKIKVTLQLGFAMGETSNKCKVMISSVIKGRHASRIRTSMDFMKVLPEPSNPYDSHAFKVVKYLGKREVVYGRLPQTIKEIFFQMDECAHVKNFQYEITWYVYTCITYKRLV